jgi:hypothetical protein
MVVLLACLEMLGNVIRCARWRCLKYQADEVEVPYGYPEISAVIYAGSGRVNPAREC